MGGRSRGQSDLDTVSQHQGQTVSDCADGHSGFQRQERVWRGFTEGLY